MVPPGCVYKSAATKPVNGSTWVCLQVCNHQTSQWFHLGVFTSLQPPNQSMVPPGCVYKSTATKPVIWTFLNFDTLCQWVLSISDYSHADIIIMSIIIQEISSSKWWSDTMISRCFSSSWQFNWSAAWWSDTIIYLLWYIPVLTVLEMINWYIPVLTVGGGVDDRLVHACFDFLCRWRW